MVLSKILSFIGESISCVGGLLSFPSCNPLPTQVWRFAEMFAGQANVSQSLRSAHYPGVSFDVEYGGKAMDLLTPSGMAFLSHLFWQTFTPYYKLILFVSGILSHFQSERTKACFPCT